MSIFPAPPPPRRPTCYLCSGVATSRCKCGVKPACEYHAKGTCTHKPVVYVESMTRQGFIDFLIRATSWVRESPQKETNE